MHFSFVCSGLSIVVSLRWKCFFCPRQVFYFPHLPLRSHHWIRVSFLLLLHWLPRLFACIVQEVLDLLLLPSHRCFFSILSPRQSVLITISVFSLLSICYFSLVLHHDLIFMADCSTHDVSLLFLVKSFSTCNRIEHASSFVCVRCPRCASSASLTVSSSLFTSISESSPPASFASASVFTLFACAAAFLFHRFFFALTQFLFCGISFFFDFFNDLLVFFSSSDSSFTVFVGLVPCVLFCCLELVCFCRTGAILLWSGDHECCHDTSVVAAHVDHIVGFGVFVVFQVSSLDYDVVDLLLISNKRFVSRLFPRSLPVHRVECCEMLHHQPMFHPVSTFASSVECVFTNTCTFNSVTWSQLSVKVSSNNRYAIFAVCRVRLNCSEHFLDVMVRISRVGDVNAHQFDPLVVYHGRCSDGPFVGVLGVDHFLPPHPVQHDSNSVFVVICPCSHECVFLVCSQISDLSGLQVSLINIASHL